MPLQPVDADVQPAVGGGIHDGSQIRQRLRADKGAVGLEDRPQGKGAYVVDAELRNAVQVPGDLVDVEIKPMVEPSPGRGVVHSEAQWRAALRDRRVACG